MENEFPASQCTETTHSEIAEHAKPCTPAHTNQRRMGTYLLSSIFKSQSLQRKQKFHGLVFRVSFDRRHLKTDFHREGLFRPSANRKRLSFAPTLTLTLTLGCGMFLFPSSLEFLPPRAMIRPPHFVSCRTLPKLLCPLFSNFQTILHLAQGNARS